MFLLGSETGRSYEGHFREIVGEFKRKVWGLFGMVISGVVAKGWAAGFFGNRGFLVRGGRGVLEGGWWDGASRAVVSRFLPPCSRDVCTTGAEGWAKVARRTPRAQRGEKEDGRGEVV